MLTVAVLAFNKPELTDACLASIAKQTYADFTTLVVDNGSEILYNVPNLPNCVFQSLIIKRVSKNVGNIQGQNLCFESATTPLVLFVSNDVRLQPGCIESLLREFKDFERQVGKCGQMQPVIKKPNGEIDNAGMDYRWPGYGIGRHRRSHDRQIVPIVPSICYLMCKEVWHEMGGFDATLPYAYEDVDMGLRLNKAGYRNGLYWYAEVTHLGNATLCGMPRVRERFHRARRQVICKHFRGIDRVARLAVEALGYVTAQAVGKVAQAG